MKHILFLLVFGAGLSINSLAQQVYQFSQYMQNHYILNTASGGQHDYLDLNTSYRKQWVGINNSPTTFYVSANKPLGKRLDLNPKASSSRISSPAVYNTFQRKAFHVVGGFVAQDAYGPYSTNIVGVSYGYHLPLAEELTLSFSPSATFSSLSFDPAKAKVEVADDPTYNNYLLNRGSSSSMDFNFSFWLYHYKFFAGYSTDQLLRDKLKLSNQITLEKLKTHHNIIAGYRIRLNPSLVLTPNCMVRYVSQAPLSADINFRLDYQERYWAGLSYRNSNSISGMIGMYLSNTFRLGYSFDFSVSAIQTHNIGSHEIVIGMNLMNKEKAIF